MISTWGKFDKNQFSDSKNIKTPDFLNLLITTYQQSV